MEEKRGRLRRVLSRIFKDRQIYHRSDGVVHFISMSAKTQIALALVVGTALLWVAYASVNVVFKEQIIVAKHRDARIMEAMYGERLVRMYAVIDSFAAEKLNSSSRLIIFCDQVNCTPEQLSYLLTGEQDYLVSVKCNSRPTSQFICDDLRIKKIQDLNQRLERIGAGIDRFFDDVAIAALFVVSKFTGGGNLWEDPEYVKEFRVAVLRTILGSLGAFLVLIFTLIMRGVLGHSRTATVEDLEKLKQDIVKNN